MTRAHKQVILLIVCALGAAFLPIGCRGSGELRYQGCCPPLTSVMAKDPPPDDETLLKHQSVGVDSRFDLKSISALVIAIGGNTKTYYLSSDGGETWSYDGYYQALFDPDSPTVARKVFEHPPSPADHKLRFRWIRVDATTSYMERTADGGTTWTRCAERVAECGLQSKKFWTGPYYHPLIPTTIFARASISAYGHSREAIYISEDAGDTFSFISEIDPFAGVTGTPIAVSLSNPAIMYMAGTFGSLQKTTDGGKVWRLVGQNEQISRAYVLRGKSRDSRLDDSDYESDTVMDIDIDPMDPCTVYVVAGKGLLRTTDGGGTWCVLNMGITEAKGIYNIAIYHKNPSVILAGTYKGLFRSKDKGCTWEFIDILSRVKK